jgi:hypothetical protein
MSLRSTWTFLVAGILLIAMANIVVLVGVVYNRKSLPESTLILTERELAPSITWSLTGENSGLDLRLAVRTPTAKSEESKDMPALAWGETPWLNLGKLRSLGFPLSASNTTEDLRRNEKLLPKDVYVVLELNGNSYQSVLQDALGKAARNEQLAKANSDSKELAERARTSRRLADAELNQESRLFCIDAGLDPVSLRNIYSDRSRFAIVRGTIRPLIYDKAGTWRVVGLFSGVRIDQINVPLTYRPVFGAGRQLGYLNAIAVGIAGQTANREHPPHYNVSVAWGQRLEPWIVSATPRAN